MIPVYESYAQALYDAAEQLDCVCVIADELTAMEELLKQCDEFLSNPLIGTSVKTAVLKETLEQKISPLMLEFILLMTVRRHLKHFHNAMEQYKRLSGHGKTVVKLSVPFMPDSDMLTQLKERFKKEKLIHGDIDEAQFEIITDEELIGGFVATCDGYQIDTSLKTILDKLRRDERLVYSGD